MGKMIDKLFSARFLMSIITTIASCFLVAGVFYACAKRDKIDLGITLVMSFLTTWGMIVKDYFNINDGKSPEPKTEGGANV